MKLRQLDKVRAILAEKKKISRNECLANFVTTRLAAYISDLKEEGWVISGAKIGNDFIYYLIEKPKSLQTEVERDERGNITRVYEVMK